MQYITLSKEDIADQHICCAFSDKKCTAGYEAKKAWLAAEFDHGYRFLRLDERAKVFIEYGPAEKAWAPINAPGYLFLGCFWVSGKYKGHGHGKALLKQVIDEAKAQHKRGLVTVVGSKKFHFMSDTRWLLGQGFVEHEQLPSGFSLISLDFHDDGKPPTFKRCARVGSESLEKGIVVYYSNRCPYTDYYVREELQKTAAKRKLPLKIHHLKNRKQAQSAPTPATLFSLFQDGKFITTDLSVCLDSRFDKIVGKGK